MSQLIMEGEAVYKYFFDKEISVRVININKKNEASQIKQFIKCLN